MGKSTTNGGLSSKPCFNTGGYIPYIPWTPWIPMVNKQLDPENDQIIVETSLPTPMTGRVYVNLPKGIPYITIKSHQTLEGYFPSKNPAAGLGPHVTLAATLQYGHVSAVALRLAAALPDVQPGGCCGLACTQNPIGEIAEDIFWNPRQFPKDGTFWKPTCNYFQTVINYLSFVGWLIIWLTEFDWLLELKVNERKETAKYPRKLKLVDVLLFCFGCL